MREVVNHLKKLRNFMLTNAGRFIGSDELNAVFGKGAWQVDLQLLVEYEGYDIAIAPALAEAGPHQFQLKTDRQLFWFSDLLPIRARHIISKRDDLCCKSCGSAQGDADPTTAGRRLRLFVSRLVDPLKWFGPASENIEVICTACREGFQNLKIDRPTAQRLKVQIRRANGEDQLEVLHWLVEKYPHQARSVLRI